MGQMQIHHRRFDLLVSKQTLHSVDTGSALNEVCCNTRAIALIWEGKSLVQPGGNRSEAE